MFKKYVTAALICAAPVAQAATLDSLELLSGFNGIVLNDMTSTVSHVEGTLFVGGDLTASSGFYVNNRGLADGTVDNVSGALIVGGNITNGLNDGGQGAIVVGGTVTGPVSAGSNARLTTGATIAVNDVAASLTELSSALSMYSDTAGASVDSSDPNLKSLTSGAGGAGELEDIAIINLDAAATMAFLSGGNLANLTLDTDVTTILNLAGDNITLSGNFNQDESSVLFNFFEATNLQINATFGFSVLSPYADVVLGSGGMDGTLVANNLDQRVELRPYGTTGVFDGTLPAPQVPAVPLPAAVWMLLAALGGLGVMGRRAA